MKNNTRSVRDAARHEYLSTQVRLCLKKGFHSFTLAFNGKTDADQASAFLKAYHSLEFNIVSQPALGRWMIYLSKK
jgi:hypothetical protein